MPKTQWTCTCPDFQRAKSALLYTRGYSSSLPSDWGDPMNEDEYARSIYCKHIWSEIRRRGEMTPSQIPLDVPYPIGTLKKDVPPPWIPGKGNYMGIPKVSDVDQKG